MAYRTRRRKSASTRRKVGAVGKRRDGITRTIGLVLGAVGTGLINKYVGTKVDGKVLAFGEVALGYFLPNFIKGNLGAGIGDGLIAAGGLNLLSEFGVLNGIPVIAGWRELSSVNGVKQPTPADRNTEAEYTPGNVAFMYNSAYRHAMDR